MSELNYHVIDSPIGQLMLVATDKGLARVNYMLEPVEFMLDALHRDFHTEPTENPEALVDVATQIDEYLAGDRQNFDIPLDLSGISGFNKTAYEQLMTVPYGETVSYKELAEMAESPRAARAAGTACAKNPIPLVIPCHRVIRTDGGMGGYLGTTQDGLAVKKKLLQLENEVIRGMYDSLENDQQKAFEVINSYTGIPRALSILQNTLQLLANIRDEDYFANVLAPMGCFIRAFHDIHACITLSAQHFYIQAIGQIRSIHEAANIGRTLAHSNKLAYEWMCGKWQPDSKARQFVDNVMYPNNNDATAENASKPYSETYGVLSKFAHITSKSAFHPYITEADEGFRLDFCDKYDEHKLRFVLGQLSNVTAFLLYTLRNSLAGPEVFSGDWHHHLDSVISELTGENFIHESSYYDELNARNAQILQKVRNNSEMTRYLKNEPNSLDNLRKRNR